MLTSETDTEVVVMYEIELPMTSRPELNDVYACCPDDSATIVVAVMEASGDDGMTTGMLLGEADTVKDPEPLGISPIPLEDPTSVADDAISLENELCSELI